MLEQGKYYHIYNRGNNRENIFLEPKNYDYFMKLYEHHIVPVADTFAYCLMKNHFHLLVRISQHLPGLQDLEGVHTPSQAFSNLFNAYTKSINKMYGRSGSLFEKNFRRIEITSDLYFTRLVHYIHYNPKKHGFTDEYRTYPYSSYQLILSENPTILQNAAVIKWFGGKNDFVEFHENVSHERELMNMIGNDE